MTFATIGSTWVVRSTIAITPRLPAMDVKAVPALNFAKSANQGDRGRRHALAPGPPAVPHEVVCDRAFDGHDGRSQPRPAQSRERREHRQLNDEAESADDYEPADHSATPGPGSLRGDRTS